MQNTLADNRERVGDMLVAGGLITSDDLSEAHRIHGETNERLVNILISMGALDARRFVEFLAEPGSLPTMDMVSFDIDTEIVALVPKNFALVNEVMPLDKKNDTLTIATVRPMDPSALEALEDHTGMKVKPLLCSSEDVRASIKRHYDTPDGESGSIVMLEGPIKLSTAVTLLRHMDALPALPSSVQRVRELLYDDESSASEAAGIISQDPAIAAKVLKVANSAAYGFSHQVDSVGLAVSLLGMLETYSVVVSTAVINIFDKESSFNHKKFWMESLLCATLSNSMAKAFRVKSTGIFSAGLLHDIGRAALSQVIPNHYAKIDATLTGAELIKAEEELMGLNHTEAGFELATQWSLPPVLAECIRYHHHPEFASDEHRKTVALINISDMLSQKTDGKYNFDACRSGLEIVDATEEEVIQIYESVPKPTPDDSLWEGA